MRLVVDAALLRSVPQPRLGLRSMLKATISTPRHEDGSVNYKAVPVGSTIWVTVKSGPLAGRPIMLTKTPDHQMALTGGAGFRQIQARRHLVVHSDRPTATAKDAAALAEREAVKERNAPRKQRIKELRHAERALQHEAETSWMKAVGVERRGLNQTEREELHAKSLDHAKALGLSEEHAHDFARHIVKGIAAKESETRKAQAAALLDHARAILRGAEPSELAPAPQQPTMILPSVDAHAWGEMSPSEREAHVRSHIDAHANHQIGAILRPDAPAPPPPAPAARAQAPERDTSTPAAKPTDPTSLAKPASTAAKPQEHVADVSTPEAAPAPYSAPTVTLGAHHTALAPMDRDAAQRAVDAFRQTREYKRAVREVQASMEKAPALEIASPASVEALRIHAHAPTDAEMEALVAEHAAKAMHPRDDAFYGAISPHWNDEVGHTLAGHASKGAASAITGLVSPHVNTRIDVQRLVHALGPEAAAAVVVHRVREHLDDEAFGKWVDHVGTHNTTNQRLTETRALDRHRELLAQEADLHHQVSTGDLASEVSKATMRARLLHEQRENLGTALGSLQSSAALYHFADEARRSKDRNTPITINVGSKEALKDKLSKLGKFEHTTSNHPIHGWRIHTDTKSLRRFAAQTARAGDEDDRWEKVKTDTSGIEPDAEGREWVPEYKVPRFRTHFPGEADLPADMKHLAHQPIRLMADQRNAIEWMHGAGGGLNAMRTGGGKTVSSIGVAAKQLADNPSGRHLRIVPDGREEQWAQEIKNFTDIPVTVLPGKSTKAERAALLRAAPPGSITVVGHTNAGRYDHEALAETHPWDSIGIDEPQELRARSGSGKMGAGAKRIFKIPAANRHALTATPATDNPVEAYDIVHWAKPGALGARTRFASAFGGFGSGTNAQDDALTSMLRDELAPHVSADRMVAPHYQIHRHEHTVQRSDAQRARQREIEAGADEAVDKSIAEAYAKKREGVSGYAETSYGKLRRDATDRAIKSLEREHAHNLGAEHGHANNPKLAALRKEITEAGGGAGRHVVFVEGPEQRRAVVEALAADGAVDRKRIYNITAGVKGDVRKTDDGKTVSAIEARKRDWKQTGGVLLIDRSSASGHNLAEGDHLHVLGNPDDAAQLLQVHGRLGRANRTGDFAIHTYRYGDSPHEHAKWNRIDRQIKTLRATAPGLFVEGMAKGTADTAWLDHWFAEVGPPYAWTGALTRAIPESIRGALRDTWDRAGMNDRTRILSAFRGVPLAKGERLTKNGEPVRLVVRGK